MDAFVDEIEAFVTGTRPASVPDQVLATVLVIEVAGTAGQAVALGDRRWADLQERFQALARRELDRFRGRPLELTGDRVVATFDGPARAIRCAGAIGGAARDLGLPTRAGLHTGECELRDERVSGVAVPLAAWVASQAAPDEILVSSTVKDLVAGAGLHFADRGSRTLAGVPGEWRLFAVLPDATESSEPTVATPPPSVLPLAHAHPARTRGAATRGPRPLEPADRRRPQHRRAHRREPRRQHPRQVGPGKPRANSPPPRAPTPPPKTDPRP